MINQVVINLQLRWRNNCWICYTESDHLFLYHWTPMSIYRFAIDLIKLDLNPSLCWVSYRGFHCHSRVPSADIAPNHFRSPRVESPSADLFRNSFCLWAKIDCNQCTCSSACWKVNSCQSWDGLLLSWYQEMTQWVGSSWGLKEDERSIRLGPDCPDGQSNYQTRNCAGLLSVRDRLEESLLEVWKECLSPGVWVRFKNTASSALLESESHFAWNVRFWTAGAADNRSRLKKWLIEPKLLTLD